MKVTITIEDEPITGNPQVRMSFDPAISQEDTADPPPALRIAHTLYETLVGTCGGKLKSVDK